MKDINLHIADCRAVVYSCIKYIRDVNTMGSMIPSYRRDLKNWYRAMRFYMAERKKGVKEI